MMVFSNRTPTPAGATTKVYEFVPPVDADGRYAISPLGPFGPAAPLWTYSNESLQTTNLSGAERLENGNTLISSGPQGRHLRSHASRRHRLGVLVSLCRHFRQQRKCVLAVPRNKDSVQPSRSDRPATCGRWIPSLP